MAEFSANANQSVAPNQPVVFTDTSVPCNRGLVFHRDGSGVFRLASPAIIGCYNSWGTCPCCCNMPEAQYLVSFHANVAFPAGTTVSDSISLAVVVDGEIYPASIMTSSPAEAEISNNVGAEISVAIPMICRCGSVSVRNIGTQTIDVSNANIVIAFQGIR